MVPDHQLSLAPEKLHKTSRKQQQTIDTLHYTNLETAERRVLGNLATPVVEETEEASSKKNKIQEVMMKKKDSDAPLYRFRNDAEERVGTYCS